MPYHAFSRLLTSSYAFSRLLTPSHAFSRLLTPSHAFSRCPDYNEHLWDLKSAWVTEGVRSIVYAGTYTLDLPQVQLRYTKIVSKVNDVVRATEELAADELLKEPVVESGTLSAGGTSLTVKPYQGGEAAEPQTLVVGKPHKVYGGKYS